PPKWTGYQLLALIFGTLLSSQGTDASFVLTLSGFSPGFRSAVLRFRLYQTLSCPTSSVLSRFSLSRFPFRRFRLYQILSGLIPSQRVVLLGLLGPCGE
ncbi:hypothetical protein ABTX80_07125, partial [Streptomyces erythrochromogenes]|uniref:hypothetical protein n=1 Tax=Streptomyces erythrochromogenes TaxID=285574 RepID=UPI003329402F